MILNNKSQPREVVPFPQRKFISQLWQIAYRDRFRSSKEREFFDGDEKQCHRLRSVFGLTEFRDDIQRTHTHTYTDRMEYSWRGKSDDDDSAEDRLSRSRERAARPSQAEKWDTRSLFRSNVISNSRIPLLSNKSRVRVNWIWKETLG